MSTHRQYKIRDYQFGFQALQLREKAGLTQIEVAASLQVTERTIQYWEGGTSRPALGNLRKLIAIYLSHGAFTPDHECDEAKALWEQACISTAHWHITFDKNWFTALLTAYNNTSKKALEGSTEQSISSEKTLTHEAPTQDWGEATDISTFYGREQELAELQQWVLTDTCRLVALLGMGGIGKTALSVKIAQHVAPHFDFVLWRSLRNAPPFEEIIADCIQLISKQHYTQLPPSNEKCIAILIDLLREKRCLLVFDNIDALLQEGNRQGHYREGCEAYGALIQRIAQVKHHSCLLLTSREMLSGLGVLDDISSPLRILKVVGLGQTASQDMLKEKELFGEPEAWSVLVDHYGGNPLALKIVAEAVRELFGGDIAAFLHEGYVIFHDIFLLLDHQFARLSPLEQDLMYWLAIERDPASLEELNVNFIHPPSKKDLLEALKSLLRRCLIERSEHGAAVFTLQPVVLEYISEQLVEQVTQEVCEGTFSLLVKYALMKGQAKEYLRHSQTRLLIQPTLKRLIAHFASELGLERHLIFLTTQLRARPRTAQGYGGGNIVNLLANLRGNIRGIDFSHLMIRQASLQGIEAQDVSFVGADLTSSVFMETFDSIASVALSQDGKYLAAGSFNGQICIWQVADGKPLLALKGHIRMVWSLAFSPDSKLLASGSYDRNVKLWDVESGQCLIALKDHAEWVRSVKFSPDGTLLASCADDETIRIWHIEQKTYLHVLRGHSGVIWSLAFHTDGKTLVSGSRDKTLKLWDVVTGACLETILTPAEEVLAVALSPDGNLIASGEDQGVRIWDRQQQQFRHFFSTRKSWTWSLAFTPDGTLVGGGDDGNVRLWNVESGQCLRTLRDHHSPSNRIWDVAVAPGNLLASGSYAGIVKLWDATTGHCLRTFQGYNRVICSLAFSPDGRILVNGDDQGMVRIWEVASGRCLHAIQGHSGRVWSAAFSPNGKTFVSGGNDLSVKVWDVASGRCLKTLAGHTEVIWSVAFSPDGSTLASGSLDRTIKLWKIKETDTDDNCFRTLQGSSWIWSLVFSADGSILASGSADGEVKIWDISSGASLQTLRCSPSPVGALAFSSDEKTLVSSSNDEVVGVWDVASGQSLKTVQGVGNANWVKSVAFSPCGALLATGCNDRTIKIWNVHDKQEVSILSGHKGGIWSVAFSPDGNTIASGGDDGIILLWVTQTGGSRGKLQSDRPFERMNIYGATGITQAQKASLVVLGAIEHAEK